MKIIIKIIIAALLLGCLARMPYGYYQFVRIASCAGFIWLAYLYGERNYIGAILSVGLAILFNPLFKITFKRDLWNDIDMWVAIALGVATVIELVYLYNGKSKGSKAN